MPQLHYLIGDATEPVLKPAMIMHCCNDCNGFGKGFVVALTNKFPKVKHQYHAWFATGNPQLGGVQFVQVTSDICVANMIGQHGTQWQGKVPPIRYDALESCLQKVYAKAAQNKVIVVAPRFGCVLAGGSWGIIGPMVEKTMTVDTYIYTVESQRDRWTDTYEN